MKPFSHNEVSSPSFALNASRVTKNSRKPKSLSQTLLDPDAGFVLIIQKQIQANFIINNEIQKNFIVLRLLTSKEKQQIKMQVMSQVDLFFYYEKILTPSDTVSLNQQYGLGLKNLPEFVLLLQKCLQQVDRSQKSISFTVETQSSLQMSISKYINNKSYLVFCISFQKLSQIEMNQMAAYRYGSLRQQIADIEIKIKETKQMVRSKNPYLLTFINKI